MGTRPVERQNGVRPKSTTKPKFQTMRHMNFVEESGKRHSMALTRFQRERRGGERVTCCIHSGGHGNGDVTIPSHGKPTHLQATLPSIRRTFPIFGKKNFVEKMSNWALRAFSSPHPVLFRPNWGGLIESIESVTQTNGTKRQRLPLDGSGGSTFIADGKRLSLFVFPLTLGQCESMDAVSATLPD